MPSLDRKNILVAGFAIVATGVAAYFARKELQKMDFGLGDIGQDEYDGHHEDVGVARGISLIVK